MLGFFTDPDVLIYLAGGSFVLGYLCISQMVLRVLLLLGTIFYLAYYATVADAPLWGAIYMSSATGAANLIGLLALFARRSRFAIPAVYRDIYPRFSHLPPGDFRALMRHGHRETTPRPLKMTTEAAPVDRLYYVIHGDISVEKGPDTFTIPSGLFVGEVSFLLKRASAATTRVGAGADLVWWDRCVLDRLVQRSPRLKLALDSAISRDMASKVALAIAPADPLRRAQVFDTAVAAQ